MFEKLDPMPADAILGLIAEHRADPRPDKVDLGVGVYRNAAGETPVLDVVKEAEQRLLATQTTKAYLGTMGDPGFNAAMQDLVFRDSAAAERLATLQTPGGSGSLRVAAGLILKARPGARVWVSAPTWNNHVPLLGGAGLALEPYAYYDTERHSLEFERMLESLNAVPKAEIVLLHACCHNPSGIDPDEDQWRAIADVVVERELVPFFDMAYQGFAQDVEADAFAIRHMAGLVPEMIVSSSCSKNFGLYRERVGALSFLLADRKARDTMLSQASAYVRTLYSMPPDHGAAVVRVVLEDAALGKAWLEEVDGMRRRLAEMRELLVDALADEAPEHDFSHLARATGMFCFLVDLAVAVLVASLKVELGDEAEIDRLLRLVDPVAG
ncbi:MAG: amino acid aminotransferase, partial [Woeseiaceae bacterium]|nr:amino acid aminotransferase [Woeseiaceae bacterium]